MVGVCRIEKRKAHGWSTGSAMLGAWSSDLLNVDLQDTPAFIGPMLK